MIASRRGFLRSLGGVAALPSFSSFSRAAVFEPLASAPKDALVRLDKNENSYGPSTKVSNAIQSLAGNVNRYPLTEEHSLAERIADQHRVKPEQILFGCGSTDILRMAAFAFLSNGKRLVQAAPTFGAIGYYAHATSAEVISVPLTPRFAHDLEGMQKQITASATLVYICNPNNPTASLTPRNDLETFVGKLPASTFVVIDEAYHHYAGESAMYASFIDRPMDNEQVIVTRTFSKVYALAGLRLGYAVSSPNTITRMRQFASQNNINSIVAQVASVALDDSNGVNEAVRRNLNDRQEFFNQAMARAVKPIDSHANFVMVNTYHPAEEVIQHFRQSNILIGRTFPPMSSYVRISLGRPEEMQRFWQVWDTLPYPKHTMQH